MNLRHPQHPPSRVKIHTSIVFDPKKKEFVKDLSIIADHETGLICEVYKRSSVDDQFLSPEDIDLRGLVVLPGFVDAHTHIFLHSYKETPALNQMRDESLIERTIRAVNYCRTALLAGYTTYRDLGTEGLQDADVNVRDAINRGLTPGPRLIVATETIASSGGYAIRQENHLGGTIVPRISDIADGVEGVRAAVRRRIGAGADNVKFYADYRKRQLRFPPENRNPNIVLFTQDEMDTIVAEAQNSDCPVAAHASSANAVIMAAKAGVTTIEHGYEPSHEALQAMKEAGTIFVPTLAVFEQELSGRIESILAHAKEAWPVGIKLACGGDTGAFSHGDNAREMELMIEAGIPLEEVLTASTLHGWEACGGDMYGRRFGWFENGTAADIIALDGDPRFDIGALRRVQFVMKDAKVWKEKGVPVGMH